MTIPTRLNDKDQQVLHKARLLQRRYAILFGSTPGQAVLDDLQSRFETDLPCFQGKAGSFDPLDAMRRDAYREVILYIRRQTTLGEQYQDIDQDHDNDD